MARDYRYGPAQKAGYQRKSQQPATATEPKATGRPLSSKGFVWLVVGLSLALAASFYITNHFKQHGPKSQWSQADLTEQERGLLVEPTSRSVAPPAPAAPAPAPIQAQPEPAPAPLVAVPLPAPVPVEADAVATVIEPSKPNFRFYDDLPRLTTVTDVQPLPVQLPEPMWIQAGSFRHLEQAQREQRRLSSDERVMQIAPIETPNGQFYRVVIGPYTDRLKLNQHRNELRRFGADTRVVKIAPQSMIN